MRTLNATGPGGRRAAVAALLLGVTLAAGCGDSSAPAATAAGDTRPATTADTAERRQVTLAVPGMDCPLCPITVRRALEAVDGVVAAEADLATKQARATFDPQRTDVARLIASVADAGFKASLEDNAHE